MTSRTYNTIANILMLVAVASALLFDSGKFPQMIAISLGAISAIVGIVLYFANQKITVPDLGKEEKPDPFVREQKQIDFIETQGNLLGAVPTSSLKLASSLKNVDVVVFGGHSLPYSEREWAMFESKTFQKDAARRFIRHYAAHHARSLQWQLATGSSMTLMKPEVELSPNEVAACAVEIIRSLSPSEDLSWDYSFGPNGLQVSIKKSRAAISTVSQEEFDFDPISRI